ncbi:MAG: segregation and condensation protein A [Actinomycetota bacterium]
MSLASITDEYLRALQSMDHLDLETATGFLVIAASLLELKSARLLPSRSGGGEAEDGLLEERDLLLARLVECATFRAAGSHLGVALERGAAFQPRSVALEEAFRALRSTSEIRVSTGALLRAALRVFSQKTQVVLDTSHVHDVKASVRDAISEIAAALRVSGHADFEQLCGLGCSRIDIVVRFLGMLELYKAGCIELTQTERFGSIQATWTGDDLSDAALEDVEEYALRGDAR